MKERKTDRLFLIPEILYGPPGHFQVPYIWLPDIPAQRIKSTNPIKCQTSIHLYNPSNFIKTNKIKHSFINDLAVANDHIRMHLLNR